MTTTTRTKVDALFLASNTVVAIAGPFIWLRVIALLLCGWYIRALADQLDRKGDTRTPAATTARRPA